ncbi:hypothetical protein PMIN07_007360 [Paraphaeosphaeria minitans]
MSSVPMLCVKTCNLTPTSNNLAELNLHQASLTNTARSMSGLCLDLLPLRAGVEADSQIKYARTRQADESGLMREDGDPKDVERRGLVQTPFEFSGSQSTKDNIVLPRRLHTTLAKSPEDKIQPCCSTRSRKTNEMSIIR